MFLRIVIPSSLVLVGPRETGVFEYEDEAETDATG
jgi:hypothetical protein